MRLHNPDGSLSLLDLKYREAQKICKSLKLKPTGKHEELIEKLLDYEIEKNINLKIFVDGTILEIKAPLRGDEAN